MFVTYGSYRVNCRGKSARGRVALSTKCGCDLEVPVLKEQFVELIGHFTVVYLVAKPLIWSEAEGDLVVLET